MEKIVIQDPLTKTFLLWDNEYRYKYNLEDKEYYLASIQNLNPKKDNTENLIKIFQFILQKQNKGIQVVKEDVYWLFNFFNATFL
jgi:hypothetical protein